MERSKASKIFLAMSLTAVTLTFATESWAARYLVAFKNAKSFSQVRAQALLSKHQEIALSDVSFNGNNRWSRLISTRIENTFEHLNAVIVNANSEEELRALNLDADVLFVEKEVFHKPPAPVQGYQRTQPWHFTLEHNLMAANKPAWAQGTPYGINLVKAKSAWSVTKGAGVRVAVLDTGVDSNHPALKSALEEGKDLTGSSNFQDEEGHGTHVAGTILAREAADGFTGVAPEARLLAGKVCQPVVCDDQNNCSGGCSNLSVAAGINWAVQKKVDVINLSLGGAIATNSEKLAIQKAETAGVIVVAASGNDGAENPGQMGYPASFPTVISVGAVDSKGVVTKFSQFSPKLSISAPGAGIVSSVPMGTGRDSLTTINRNSGVERVESAAFSGGVEIMNAVTGQLVEAGLGKPEDFVGKNLTGKFALIQRGEIYFSVKVRNAMDAGASGVIFYNNADGLVQGAVTQEDGTPVKIPVVMIEKAKGEALVRDLAQGQNVSMTLKTETVDYARFDGTSMASPHVAGVVALMRGAKKTMTPAQARNVLKTTAQTPPEPNTDNKYGAGIVDAAKAVRAAAALP